MNLSTASEQRCFEGVQGFYTHSSRETNTRMRFGVFCPPQAGPRPVIYCLAGLTCNEETFATKAGAQRLAAKLGMILVTPDTSPRGTDLPGEHENWDFGTSAGYYTDATQSPWAVYYRMASYVANELPTLIESSFQADPAKRGILGHSMGGHGAITLALLNPSLYQSVSAFAPIANPASVPWGQKAFTQFLGADQKSWRQHDSSWLIKNRPSTQDILVDQGLADQFLDTQLHPHALSEAAAASGQKLTLRLHNGYDHSYYFVQSFVTDHLHWHAARLA